MKNVINVFLLFFVFIGCEDKENDENQYVAKIVGYDLNCSTCIITFPNDSLEIKNIFGASKNNYYMAVNLRKEDFKIGQLVKMNLRNAADS